MFDGLAVDAKVHEKDDEQRDVEGPGCREEHVSCLCRHRALVGILAGRLLPADEGGDGDGHGQQPDEDDDVDSAALGHDGGPL